LVNSEADPDWNLIAFEAKCPVDTQDPQDRKLIDDRALFLPATPIIAAWGDKEAMTFHANKLARSTVRFF